MRNPCIDLTGETFGRLTVVARVANDSKQKTCFRCRCVCGQERIVRSESLRSGHTQSCGCYNEELKKGRKAGLSHGYYGTPTYRSWTSAKSRCSNPKDPAYARYGGRGITMCARWRDSFEAFLADMGLRPTAASLDRYPNNDGHYEPGNARWATPAEQNKNRRRGVAHA